MGIENRTEQTPREHFQAIKDAFDFFAQNPDQKARYLSACGKYQAGISLILENCNFQGNDKATRTVVLMRTENPSIFGGGFPPIGKLSHHVGVNESHSIFKTVRVEGSVLTMVRVPYHRITGMYMLEQNPGAGDCGFLGDSENEFNADTHGLDIFSVRDYGVSGGLDVAPFRKVFDQLENSAKNP